MSRFSRFWEWRGWYSWHLKNTRSRVLARAPLHFLISALTNCIWFSTRLQFVRKWIYINKNIATGSWLPQISSHPEHASHRKECNELRGDETKRIETKTWGPRTEGRNLANICSCQLPVASCQLPVASYVRPRRTQMILAACVTGTQ